MSTGTQTKAEEVLQLPAGANVGEAAGAFLAALPSVDFMPSSSRIAAVNVLVGSSIPFDAQEEHASPVEPPVLVVDFIRRFWSLDPNARIAEWVALSQCEEADPVHVRLMALKSGLELSADACSDPIVEEVARLARELFLLPLRTRAIRRNEWLLANASRHAELVGAASNLRRQRPAMANLEPQLFARLSVGFNASEFAAIAEERIPDSAQSAEVPKTDFVKRYEARNLNDDLQHEERGGAAQQTGSGLPSGAVWAIVVGLFIFVRMFIGLNSPSSTPHPPVNSQKQPVNKPFVPKNEADRFDAAESERRMKELESRKNPPTTKR